MVVIFRARMFLYRTTLLLSAADESVVRESFVSSEKENKPRSSVGIFREASRAPLCFEAFSLVTFEVQSEKNVNVMTLSVRK
jgi:hypothetical protein